jgi:hypothetical protein
VGCGNTAALLLLPKCSFFSSFLYAQKRKEKKLIFAVSVAESLGWTGETAKLISLAY